MTFVFIYYDNPQMLAAQIARCWNTYEDLPARPRIVLVDDGSPHHPAADVVWRSRCALPIEVYRIHQDIAWNFTGARNLGCSVAGGDDWIHVSDIDTMLFRDDAARLLASDLDPACFYLPRRVCLPEDRPMIPAIVNLIFHRSKYDESGGYDEDFAGHYGREHAEFLHRLKLYAQLVKRDDLVVRLMPPWLVADAKTKTGSRDDDRNTDLFLAKSHAGFPRPRPGLRFTWERVI